MNLRRSLSAAVAAVLVLFPGSRALAASPDAGPDAPTHFTLVPVGDGVYAAIAKEHDMVSGANAGFVVGTTDVLVVDSFQSPPAAEELAAEIKRITPLPIRWLVNTHYHIDHVGGNGVFAKLGASIVAHENVRAWIRSENLKFFPGEKGAAERDLVASLPLPDVTHRNGLAIWAGDRKVEVQARDGHTGGDSVVFVPSADVVFTGDLFWNHFLPNLIDASTEPWIATLDGFLQAHPGATFVPGHGEVGKALEVRMFRDYLSSLRVAVAKGLAAGKSGKELAEDVATAQRARYGTWGLFDAFGKRNVELTEQEIKKTKKLPKPPAGP